jgi:hypothetical protein
MEGSNSLVAVLFALMVAGLIAVAIIGLTDQPARTVSTSITYIAYPAYNQGSETSNNFAMNFPAKVTALAAARTRRVELHSTKIASHHG